MTDFFYQTPLPVLPNHLYNSSLRKVCNVSVCVHYNLPKDHTHYTIFMQKSFDPCTTKLTLILWVRADLAKSWTRSYPGSLNCVSQSSCFCVYVVKFALAEATFLNILMKSRHTELNLGGATVPYMCVCVCVHGRWLHKWTHILWGVVSFHRKQ